MLKMKLPQNNLTWALLVSRPRKLSKPLLQEKLWSKKSIWTFLQRLPKLRRLLLPDNKKKVTPLVYPPLF